MPLQFSTHDSAGRAMEREDFGIHRVTHERVVIRFGLKGNARDNVRQMTCNLPAGTPVHLARASRDTLRQAVERGLIADENDWHRKTNELIKAIAASIKCMPPTFQSIK